MSKKKGGLYPSHLLQCKNKAQSDFVTSILHSSLANSHSKYIRYMEKSHLGHPFSFETTALLIKANLMRSKGILCTYVTLCDSHAGSDILGGFNCFLLTIRYFNKVERGQLLEFSPHTLTGVELARLSILC